MPRGLSRQGAELFGRFGREATEGLTGRISRAGASEAGNLGTRSAPALALPGSGRFRGTMSPRGAEDARLLGMGAPEAEGARTLQDAGLRRYMGKRHEDVHGKVGEGIQSLREGNIRQPTPDVVDSYVAQARMKGTEFEGPFRDAMGKGDYDRALGIVGGDAYKRDFMARPQVADHLGHRKLPQKGAAVVGGSWLVSNMSARRGQMSNNELYGQSSPYR